MWILSPNLEIELKFDLYSTFINILNFGTHIEFLTVPLVSGRDFNIRKSLVIIFEFFGSILVSQVLYQILGQGDRRFYF